MRINIKKYIGFLIILLLILVPRTNSKYVLSDAKNLGIKTPGFDMLETKDYTKDFIEIKIKNKGKKDAKGEIVIEGVKIKDVNVAAGKEVTYKFYLTKVLYNKLVECDIYPVKVNYLSPYKISKDVTTIKKNNPTNIHGKVKCMNLGSAKDKGIDYSKVNSLSNGEGVYLFDETKNDAHPVYFFRGTHNLKNNLLYANICWKIVRTTETGGVRIIYNGKPVSGKCTNTTGTNTQIGESIFNPTYTVKQHVGYMFGDDTNPYENTNDSDIKKYIDNWYKTNIKDKGFESSLDKGSIYCGDRTEGTDKGNYLQYSGRDRAEQNKPSLKCPSNDSYGLAAGNRKLTYPAALLSSDEVMLAGGPNWIGSNNNYYLYTNSSYWLLSPGTWARSGGAGGIGVASYGNLGDIGVPNPCGVRPAITIKGELPVLGGDGSKDKPFVMTKDKDTLFKKIKEQSLGNDKEKGIDYSKANSETNGEGVYLLDETKNAANPVYFFRGTHNLKNNLLYANLCWKIVRTTETGGIKLIYNGVPVNGRCSITTGNATQIGEKEFNIQNYNKKYVGYLIGSDSNPYSNLYDSDIKKYLDNWYKNNIKDKGFEVNLDKKSIYCGDRTEGQTFENSTNYLNLDRLDSSRVSLNCPVNDSYSVEGGNKKLIYPIALLSVDDFMLAGVGGWDTNNNYYLYNGKEYWHLSPYGFSSSNRVSIFRVANDGRMVGGVTTYPSGVRPSLTILNSTPLLSGDGSQNNPYII